MEEGPKEIENSNVGAAIEVVERLGKLEGVALYREDDLVVIPHGKKVVDLRPYEDARLDAPRRKEGCSKHTTIRSLVDHVNRTKDADSVLFANDDPRQPAIVAVYDYNCANGDPRFGKHRAVYAFPLSEEWQAWQAASSGVRDLAELLEARILDVLPPSTLPTGASEEAKALGLTLATQAGLLGVAKGLSLRVAQTVVNVQNIGTGEVEVAFEAKHEAKTGGSVVVPTAFALGIPVFRGGVRYPVLARLRYRVTEGVVTWGVRLHRADRVFRDAFEESCTFAQYQTGIPLFYGASE